MKDGMNLDPKSNIESSWMEPAPPFQSQGDESTNQQNLGNIDNMIDYPANLDWVCIFFLQIRLLIFQTADVQSKARVRTKDNLDRAYGMTIS